MAFTSVIKMIKMGSDKSNHIFYMAIFADLEIKYRYSDNSKSHHLQQMSYVQHQLSSWLIWMRTEFMHVFFLTTLHQQVLNHRLLWPSLKRKCCRFDEIFITGCTGSCQNDNFQCSQWWKFRQNDDIFVSVFK